MRAHSATLQARSIGILATLGAFALVVGVVGCEAASPLEGSRKAPGEGETAPDPSASTPAPLCTTTGKEWRGFAGTPLVQGRAPAVAGADRQRVKPYEVLAAEYERTIGTVPASLPNVAGAFGPRRERFASEPQASAITLWSTYRVAFDGCLTFTATAPDFANAPTEADAAKQCTAMARKFWSRAPSQDEVTSCAQVALVDSASEADPRRRWAHTCAALLSASGFLTY